ncbi:ribulose-phosphate 3-epimerase [Bernardetia litoralis DSM 6794]|uniref:Ribulose-phosphate 3-epimerase n=1 Tax=Bernardetia litoralis (strain ATCC 23117 / DSM 6794 / NBRC 15988 / NCIMB 1366 / Fx l1 / Sio-4) TaxID=880071 RepID=I4AKH9_BERLS|nr:ribulose-phosphate 3-epimerase [Bernardetia litoralis]AFM04464.1 ribulose-phosphate 3-epimerase [Bernardetia litoralis DSM 6794]
MLLAPSILASDFANLQSEVEMLNKSQADWIHIDIMDGVFVPNISFGIPVCKAIAKHAKKHLDVHLMIVNPENYVENFARAGANTISVHIEACQHLHRNLQQIRNLGCQAGIAVNPHTSISQLENVIEETDLVCLMSVNPGFGGQKFIEQTYKKVSELKELILKTGSKALIEIDGGVNADNAKKLVDAGADVLVAGSFVFSSSDPMETISNIKHIS